MPPGPRDMMPPGPRDMMPPGPSEMMLARARHLSESEAA